MFVLCIQYTSFGVCTVQYCTSNARADWDWDPQPNPPRWDPTATVTGGPPHLGVEKMNRASQESEAESLARWNSTATAQPTPVRPASRLLLLSAALRRGEGTTVVCRAVPATAMPTTRRCLRTGAACVRGCLRRHCGAPGGGLLVEVAAAASNGALPPFAPGWRLSHCHGWRRLEFPPVTMMAAGVTGFAGGDGGRGRSSAVPPFALADALLSFTKLIY